MKGFSILRNKTLWISINEVINFYFRNEIDKFAHWKSDNKPVQKAHHKSLEQKSKNIHSNYRVDQGSNSRSATKFEVTAYSLKAKSVLVSASS